MTQTLGELLRSKLHNESDFVIVYPKETCHHCQNVTHLPEVPLNKELHRALATLAQYDRVAAIRFLRYVNDLPLKEAKLIVEAIMRGQSNESHSCSSW